MAKTFGSTQGDTFEKLETLPLRGRALSKNSGLIQQLEPAEGRLQPGSVRQMADKLRPFTRTIIKGYSHAEY